VTHGLRRVVEKRSIGDDKATTIQVDSQGAAWKSQECGVAVVFGI
jgi:hypothetical protein